jgi:hypothetical protein
VEQRGAHRLQLGLHAVRAPQDAHAGRALLDLALPLRAAAEVSRAMETGLRVSSVGWLRSARRV